MVFDKDLDFARRTAPSLAISGQGQRLMSATVPSFGNCPKDVQRALALHFSLPYQCK